MGSKAVFRGCLLFIVVGLAVGFGPVTTTQANAAVQIVFSGQFPSSPTSGDLAPFGFWVWCEAADAGNPYAGVCWGSIYFYELGLVRAVVGSVAQIGVDQFRMSVASFDGQIDCNLWNEPPVMRGPNNTVQIACNAPAGTGTAPGSVVQVTGP